MMTEDTFYKFHVGDVETVEHSISESDINKFAELSGDNNPLHMDDNFSSRTRFGKRVAHGFLSASFISTIIGTKLPGPGALWQSLNIQFLAPVFIGDSVIVSAEVTHKSESQRVFILAIKVVNQFQKEV